MKANLTAQVAEHYELVWTGGDAIYIPGFGQVIFSMLDLALAERVSTELLDSESHPLYLKKKVKEVAKTPAKPADK